MQQVQGAGEGVATLQPRADPCPQRAPGRGSGWHSPRPAHTLQHSHILSSFLCNFALLSCDRALQGRSESLQTGLRLSLGPRTQVPRCRDSPRGTCTLSTQPDPPCCMHAAALAPTPAGCTLRPVVWGGGALGRQGWGADKLHVCLNLCTRTNASQTASDKEGNLLGQETKRVKMWFCFCASWTLGFSEVHRSQWAFMLACFFLIFSVSQAHLLFSGLILSTKKHSL